MMSYERGERKEYGHLQGITRIMTHVSLKDRIRKWMRAALLLGTSQYRVKIGLVFFTGQEWTYMGGYIQERRQAALSRGEAEKKGKMCPF